MKALIAITQSGIEIPISIEIKPNYRIQEKATFNGKEYPCELSKAKEKGVYIPTILFSSNSLFLKENFPQLVQRKEDIHVKLNQDWKPVIEELKLKQAEIWKEEAENLILPGTLELKYHSFDKWSILNSEIPHYLIQFHSVLSNLNELNHRDFTPTSSDYDDYNSWDFYTISYADVVENIRKNLDIKEAEQIRINHRIEISKKVEDDKKAELYKNVANVEKSKVRTSPGSDGDDYEQDITITMKSGKSYKFKARNIFDFGYVLNPTFIEGGGMLMDVEAFIVNNNYSFDTEDKKEQYRTANPTQSGWIWNRYNEPSIPVSFEELEAAHVAMRETRNLTGVRL